MKTLPTTFRADGGTRAQRLRDAWRRHRFWLIVGTVFVVVTGGGLILGTSGQRSAGELSITNPAPDGAQAAATVLAGQGVDVTATDSMATTTAALGANGQGSSTVLVFDPQQLLSPEQGAELAASAAEHGSKIVAITPGPLLVGKFSGELASAGSLNTGREGIAANCAQPDALAAGSIVAPGSAGGAPGAPGGTVVKVYLGPESCFAPSGTAGAAGLLATTADGAVSALGSAAVVSNDGLARAGNAALTFRLLGSRKNLVWYTASAKDIPVSAQPPSLAELTPQWVFPASAWLLLVGVIGMLWRGRRDGPLVVEPMPVVVKASETVAGRARLYQDAKAVDTAARTLQDATLNRLSHTLRLGGVAPPEAVAEAVSVHLGRDHQALFALLIHDVPRTEKDMLTMATQLAALEEEVARR
ncbi:DUF4350 domain-containing protein [Arthrobacter alpinus]|uniref:DUF4350 domain-containing protein n=1 Tax=Arthrobacter alpinus TaxID=656366 RepID=UPI0016471467|nr:DUF4350 domain-containing protein [Arthrobacter alpinus]